MTLNANGTVPNSATTAALTAGSYSYIGVYSGDSNYTGYTGAVEPLTINKASSSVSTAIYDSDRRRGDQRAGREGVRHGDGDRHAVHADRHGDLRVLHAPSTAPARHVDQTVTLNADGTVPNSATTARADGRQLLLHRRLQRRQQLHRLHRRRRAADDQPRLARASARRSTTPPAAPVDQRAGREGVRHGDGDRDAVHADRDGDLRVLHTHQRHRLRTADQTVTLNANGTVPNSATTRR